MRRRLHMIMMMAAAAALWGCSGDDEANNATANNMSATTAPVGTTPDTFRDVYSMRFTRMGIKPATPAFRLQAVIGANFDQRLEYPIIVLFELSDVEADAGAAKLRASAGLKTGVEEQYRWDPVEGSSDEFFATSFVADEATFDGTIPRFFFRATVDNQGTVENYDIPLNDLKFSGRLVEDGGVAKVTSGTLAGYIRADEAREVNVDFNGMIISLATVLNEDRVDFDADGDGTDESWFLEADFDARETTIIGN